MLLPAVSVIIPAYRSAGTICRAVDSVLSQSHLPQEILVVDDGSPDGLASVLCGYPEVVRVLRKANGGAASARNFGIEHAQGDLIAFLDADDWWEPAKLQRQIEILQRYPEVGLAACRYFEQLPGGPRKTVGGDPDPFTDRPLIARRDGLVGIVTRISTITVVVRRDVLGGERFRTDLATAEDRDMWIRLAGARPVYILGDRLATAVLQPGSLSRSDADRDRQNMLRVISEHQHLLGAAQRRAWEARVYRGWAADHLGNGKPRRAIAPAWHRVCRNPISIEGWYVLLKSALLGLGSSG
jgi:glycosyltransferase involved in cell wall biosynthesis